MPDRVLAGVEPSDLRFQFKIIEGLSESIRQQSASTERLASAMAEMQKTQVGMLERLAKLEANRFGEALAKVEGSVGDLDRKVDALMKDKDRRDGALGLLGAIKSWAPFLAMLFSAASVLWLYGRSAGFVPAPPVAPTKVEATIDHGERKIEGIVGGKP